MTPRQAFIHALERKPQQAVVPHFELVFFLTMEAFGKVHPQHRSYHQWKQMTQKEQDLHRNDIADLYIQIARKYEHSAIFFIPPQGWGHDELYETMRTQSLIREKTGSTYFLMMHGDATFSIPGGDKMAEFFYRIADEPQQLKDEAQQMVDTALASARIIKTYGVLDGFGLCSDYCFNTGPFLSPAMFDEFIAPYLKQLIKGYRELGFYTIKHTDGNIMPILGSLVDAKPDALHSLDPQGGVDIAEVKRLIGDKLCLIGNVNCSLMDTGTDEEVIASTEYAVKHGSAGGGYIFSTSNCIYTGMDLRRYELMLQTFRSAQKNGRAVSP